MSDAAFTRATTRVAVITGGAEGIGGATADLLESRGWVVHRLDVGYPETADRRHRCDVTSEADLRAAADAIGPIDALVTAAGINLRPHDGPAERLELDAWHRTLAVNLTGTMLTVRAFQPLIRDDGAIVTVGSVAGISAVPWADAYTASKGGVVALTRSWAVDYSRHGIRVNCVCPGSTETRMMDGIYERFPPEKRQQLPQQRMATAREVAETIAFLAAPEAGYLSGAIIPLDGGATAQTAGLPFPTRRPRTSGS